MISRSASVNPNPSQRHVNHMTGPLLSWQDAAAIIDDCDSRGVPVPFAVTFCTADEEAGTGGEIIRYDKAVRHVAGGKSFRGRQELSAERVALASANPMTRWLRKIRSVANLEIRNVHLHLILEINGRRVR